MLRSNTSRTMIEIAALASTLLLRSTTQIVGPAATTTCFVKRPVYRCCCGVGVCNFLLESTASSMSVDGDGLLSPALAVSLAVSEGAAAASSALDDDVRGCDN
jgi:hypothetical protein